MEVAAVEAAPSKQKISIIYDGACPLCKRFSLLLELKKHYVVDLFDARTAPIPAWAKECDLDDGMAVQINESIYSGADAMYVLANASEPGFLKVFFAARPAAKMLYPVLRLSRNLLLKLLGRSKINESIS